MSSIVSKAPSPKRSNLNAIDSDLGLTAGPLFLSLRKAVIDSKLCLNSSGIFSLLNLQLTRLGSFFS